MTIEPADLARHSGPTYLALADTLAEAIGEGRIEAGARLPTQRDLAYRLQVTVGTVGRAYELLAQRGLTRGEVGRGTYVLGHREPIHMSATETTADGGLIDLTANFPAPVPAQAALGDLLPIDESAVEVLGALLCYPDMAGAAHHRAAAADWLMHLGLATAPENIVLANGAQGALAAVLSALARPGDTILSESLCYSGLRSLAGRLGQNLEPVGMDEEGVLPDALAAVVRQRGARILVLSPTIQNPTAALMPQARREALSEVARSLDLLLIEDDVYGPLVSDRPAALAVLAPERTIYLGSVSKFLAPGLRLGFAVGPLASMRAVAAAQRELCLGLPPFSGEIFTRGLRAGVVAEALRQQRLEMSARQELASIAPRRSRSAPPAHRSPRLGAAAAALDRGRGGAGSGPGRRPGDARGTVLHRSRRGPGGDPDLALGASHPRASARRPRADREGAGDAKAAAPARWCSREVPRPRRSREG